MKERETDVLYGNVTITHLVPSSYDEGDKVVGQIGGVLDGFISDTVARNFLPRLYREVTAQFVAQFPKKRSGGTEDKPVFPTDIAYLGTLWDEHRELRKEIDEAFQAMAKTVPFFKESERSGGGKISQAAMDAANKYIAEGTEERAATVIEEKCGYKVQRDEKNVPTVEGLARGIQALQKHLQKVAERQVAAEIGT